MSHATRFFEQAGRICAALDHDAIERLAQALAALRDAGYNVKVAK